jgi:dihydroflavonol-4-reductase
MATVLVTGGSGFVGAHCIVALLKAGHTVRTTIRNLSREEVVRNMLREGGAMELAVVNPVGIFGPALGPDTSTSILIVQRLMNGEVPGMPNLNFGLVDVRDVADLHLLAMINPAARGQRFLAVAGDFVAMSDIAKMLKARLGAAAGRVPTRRLPDWLVRVVGLFDPSVKLISSELGIRKNATNAKAKRLLGWSPRSNEESIVATAESLLKLGMLKDSPKKAA